MLVLVGAAVAVGLGVWQMRRLAWKEDLLARLEAGRAQAAEPLPEAARWAAMPVTEMEYRRFTAHGVFAPAQALVFAGPVETPNGPRPGYFVMATLETPEGGRLLTHRGVLPIEMKDAVPPPPAGEATVTGLMRAPERAGWFTPADEPGKGAFFLRDPAALAPALGAGLSPFFLDEESSPGAPPWPRQGAGTLAPPNNHLSYALTWFGLAGALLVVFGLSARRR
jgi:surfeit locus 1 family protein